MENYFEEIVASLSVEDLKILSALNDNEAEVKFKAIKKSSLCEISKLSIANFRKSLYRLEIAKFIEIATGQKDHKVYITNYGIKALFSSISKEVI
ncbi:hypothetical protein KDN24_06300 [Bacillus sp. Bva_UNVM-123]|uniref:hypothetical protein n=1 Tax=Bacillus sp. Bva_UNVM-123 TaxID=2829798 RepID=UPI00391FC19E